MKPPSPGLCSDSPLGEMQHGIGVWLRRALSRPWRRAQGCSPEADKLIRELKLQCG